MQYGGVLRLGHYVFILPTENSTRYYSNLPGMECFLDTLIFLYTNLFYKNVEAGIGQNF